MTIREHDALIFSRNVCLLRRRRGLSQEALAKRAGIQRDSLQKIEAGKSRCGSGRCWRSQTRWV